MLNRLVNSVDHQLCLMNEFKIFMTMVCGLEAGLEERREEERLTSLYGYGEMVPQNDDDDDHDDINAHKVG